VNLPFKMRVPAYTVVAAVLGVFMAPLAPAQEPAPDAKALGITEALLSYCARVDPTAAPRFQERVKSVAMGASDDVLARLRQSEDYMKAHAAVDDFVAKVDEHNAKKVCMEPPARSKTQQ